MNPSFIKCLMIVNNNKFEIKLDMNRRISICSYCIGYNFKKFATINEKKLNSKLNKRSNKQELNVVEELDSFI